MRSNPFPIAAVTLPGCSDPSVAIAASRAGALGILNLEFTLDPVEARSALSALVRRARGQTGVKFSSACPALLDALVPGMSESVHTVLLTAEDMEAVAGQVQMLHETGRRVWLEFTSGREAAEGPRCRVDGLVAKGNEAGGWVADETAVVLAVGGGSLPRCGAGTS